MAKLPGGPRSVAVGATVAAALGASLWAFEAATDRGEVYVDIVGKATVCDGLTHWFGKALDPNKHYTHAECNDMLASDLAGREQRLEACDLPVESMPERVQFGVQHFSYNVGTYAVCTSRTVAVPLRRGDYDTACNGMRQWTWVTSPKFGKVNCRDAKWKCSGLPTRRDYEADTCLGNIDWRSQPWDSWRKATQ